MTDTMTEKKLHLKRVSIVRAGDYIAACKQSAIVPPGTTRVVGGQFSGYSVSLQHGNSGSVHGFCHTGCGAGYLC